MIRRVKKAFVDNLPNLEWMDNQTRADAIGKVRVRTDAFIVSFEAWRVPIEPFRVVLCC